MKKIILVSAILASTSPAMAELSGSAGFVTDFVSRGTTLGDAGAYVSGEFSESGFTAGVWAIQDSGRSTTGKGIEVDLYTSYKLEVNDDFSAKIGATSYSFSYTDFSKIEANIGAAFGPVALDAAIGKISPEGDADNVDYVYASIAGDAGPVNVKVGAFDLDSNAKADDYMHLDFTVGHKFESLDVNTSVTAGVKKPNDDDVNTEEYIFLNVSKSF